MPRPRSVIAVSTQPSPDTARARTLAEVALALGVSRTTVSNAFNRPGQLSEGLRTQILEGSRALGYFGPNVMARAMRSREMREVAVVFHHDLRFALTDPASLAFLRGVADELDKRRLSLQLIPQLGRLMERTAAFQTTADALIVHAEINGDLAAEVNGMHKPLVLVDAWVAGKPTVSTDDRIGAALAMDHVLKAKPDRIILIIFPIDPPDRERAMSQLRPARNRSVGFERLVGYGKSIRAHGFPQGNLLWAEVDDRFPDTAGEVVAPLLAQLPAQCTFAVVAMSDRMALAALPVIKTWRKHKLLSAVGFDDIPGAAPAGLTTVRQDMHLKGELAVQIVLDGLESKTLAVQLVVRKT